MTTFLNKRSISTMNNKSYIAFCDGSCQLDNKGNNVGGYGAVIYDQNHIKIKELKQGYYNTTNNRQEIMSVLAVLEYFTEPVKISFFCDSQYVLNTIEKGWAKKWFENQDYSKKNLDLWYKIINLVEFHDCEWNWVKGHNNNPGNERANFLAQFAAKCLNLPKDECTTNI